MLYVKCCITDEGWLECLFKLTSSKLILLRSILRIPILSLKNVTLPESSPKKSISSCANKSEVFQSFHLKHTDWEQILMGKSKTRGTLFE